MPFSHTKIARIGRLLSLYASEGVQAFNVIPEELLPQAELVLNEFKKKNVLPFDPYRISGYAPSENQISDTLRHILNPAGVHRLGFAGIHALLDSVKDRAEQDIILKANGIRSILNHTSAVRVKREMNFENGRVDIHISAPSQFLIIIENKSKRDASEVGKIPQTIRYEALLQAAEDNGCTALGIYLTPDKKLPQSEKFVAVSCAQFADCLRNRISTLKNALEEETRSLLLAFTLTYAWMN